MCSEFPVVRSFETILGAECAGRGVHAVADEGQRVDDRLGEDDFPGLEPPRRSSVYSNRNHGT